MKDAEDDELRVAADLGLLKRAWPLVRPDLGLYLVALAAAPITAGLSILQPWLVSRLIDQHLVPGHPEGVNAIVWAYFATVVLAFVAESTYTLAIATGSLKTITRLRRVMYAHTLRLSQSFYDVRPTGRILTRITSDVEALGEVLSAGAITIVLDALLVVGILCAMAWLEWRLTLVSLVLGPPIAFIVDRIRRVLRGLFIESRATVSALNAFTAERLAGAEIVQLYSDEQRSVAKHDALLERYRVSNVRTNLWDALLYAIMDGMTSIAVALMLWYGAGLGDLVSAGVLAAFIDYIARLFRPIQEFSAKIAVLQRAGTSLEKIFGLLEHPEVITTGDVTPTDVKGHFVLSGVSFGYAPGSDVLSDVSFEVRPGEVVALVGRTGSGKSTIARLLTRTYDGYRGSLTLDGIELSRLVASDLRRNIGTVRQDVQLFPGTVRFNLAFGRAIRDEELTAAIVGAQAEEVVARLGGLDGAIDHRGGNLSVGEAQLLAFARVLAHDPPVVVLDEATASVDTLTEARIEKATRAVLERKTVIVIAHRLSTVIGADRIVVLDHGRVVEQGSHAELLSHDGAWAALYRAHFAHDATPAVVPPNPAPSMVGSSTTGVS